MNAEAKQRHYDQMPTRAIQPNAFVVVARPGAVWAGRLGEVTWLVREEGATARAASDLLAVLLTHHALHRAEDRGGIVPRVEIECHH